MRHGLVLLLNSWFLGHTGSLIRRFETMFLSEVVVLLGS